MEKNIVRQIKVQKMLGEMLEANPELYEKVLDSNISFYFNEIANLAMMDSFSKPKTEPKTGIELIAEERLEQLTKHNRTIEKDVEQNNNYELRRGAIALLEDDSNKFSGFWNKEICDKMANKSYKERLIIAGAFIAAELDRLQAAASVSSLKNNDKNQ